MAVTVGGAGVMAMAVVHVDVFDKLQAGQQIHRPVDAGQANSAVDLSGAPVYLSHLQMLCGIGQHLEHREA
jgi:hypothetical protein